MSSMGFGIAVSSHAVAALTFGLLTVYLIASVKSRGAGILLIFACAATAIWGVVHIVDDLIVPIPRFFGFTHTLLNATWIAFLISLIRVHWKAVGYRKLAVVVPIVLGVGLTLAGVVDMLYALNTSWATVLDRMNYPIYRGLTLSVVSLVLVENVFLNTRPANRWSIKFLCFALGGIFIYDFFVYSHGLFHGHVSPILFQARGAVSALVVPLIMISAARNPAWSLDVFFSRRFALRLFSLAGSILYLLVLFGLGSLAELVGGAWGAVLETLVLFAGGLLLVSVLVSGRFRSEIAIFLNKNFFTYKFDYREEWLRFLSTVSKTEEYPDLAARVIKGIADISDSPGGVLWLRQPDGGFLSATRWNFRQEIIGTEPDNGPVARFLRETGWIVNLNELDEKSSDYANFVVPAWLSAIKGAWLVVPLFHRDVLSSFIVLLQPRAPRKTNWEDFDLLKTVSTHSASYLAEQETEKALAEARQFDTFNRQFTFIVHDIKNLVGQLSLLTENAEKHGDDPVFRADMVATVRSSVSKLKIMLSRLNEEGDRQRPPKLLSLPKLVQQVTRQMKKRGVKVRCECRCSDVWISAYRDRLASVFRQLIQNALDVLSDEGHVEVIVRLEEGAAIIEIIDDGPGVTREFVQNELFQPFKTTKPNGYGIGAYEAREMVKELGGSIAVDSAPGEGTSLSIRLPIVNAASNSPLPNVSEDRR